MQTEKVMKALYVRKLFLWPRFQMSVKEALEENVATPADVGTRLPCPCMASLQEVLKHPRADGSILAAEFKMSAPEWAFCTCCSWWSLRCQ